MPAKKPRYSVAVGVPVGVVLIASLSVLAWGRGMKEGATLGSWCQWWRSFSRMFPSALSLIKSRAVCGNTDPVKSGICGWVVGMPCSGPVCRSCLISFSTQIAAQGGSCWSLAEGTSAEQESDRDGSASGSCCAATAVCHSSRKKATFPRWCCGEWLVLMHFYSWAECLAHCFSLALSASPGFYLHTNVDKIWVWGRTFPLLPFLPLVSYDRRCPAFINMVLASHFQFTTEETKRFCSRKDAFKIDLVPGKEKEAVCEHIQNNGYIACFHSTIKP